MPLPCKFLAMLDWSKCILNFQNQQLGWYIIIGTHKKNFILTQVNANNKHTKILMFRMFSLFGQYNI